ncbi:P-loop containing nucleoside triphosphate hydrolase protein [Collybia nuda]|uniref:small monomeric GTPase n=1 Tax=Collybia nuda TaxID=64659 RepID=A0A9P5XYH1_9AGAR|nr:P-loop containing nucleoside triphosphate hydrolase protein [Collybia nuda]
MMVNPKMKEYKILLIGRFAIGKTAIIEQFIFQKFPMQYGPTQEAVSSTQCIIDGETVSVDILEITIHEYARAHSIRPEYINHAEGLLLAYSVASRISFNEMQEIYQHILQIRGQASFPTILIGNIFDLGYDREVTFAEGNSLAEQIGCPFFEVSARDGTNIEKSFHDLIHRIRRYVKGQNSGVTTLATDAHKDIHDNDDYCCSRCITF